ncbi:MAG: hypothetical protein HYZ75_17290 [Elusimicrobia bacterium]|nr:hypothetical protein [Elusimicrobiota bacterium]
MKRAMALLAVLSLTACQKTPKMEEKVETAKPLETQAKERAQGAANLIKDAQAVAATANAAQAERQAAMDQ